MIEKLKVSHRLALMVLAGVLGGLLTLGDSIYSFQALLHDANRVQVQRLVETASATLSHYQALESSQKMERGEAQRLALQQLRTLRFGNNDYFWVNDLTPTMLMHPIKPELEGQAVGGMTDAHGKRIFDAFVQTAKTGGGGFVDYFWVKPGQSAPVAKVSYVKLFEPWGWVVGSGIYVDDLDAVFWRHTIRSLVLGTLATLLLLAVAYLVSRSVMRQLGGEPAYACQVAHRIANGELDDRIAVIRDDRQSIVANMETMQTRLREMIAEIRNNAAELGQEASALAQRSGEMETTTTTQFETTAWISSAMEEMAMTVVGVGESARATGQHSEQASVMAREGGAIVRRSAEEIEQIATVIAQSTTQIETLRQRTDDIGSIAGVIKEIAGQTNLLALNAAIEAARAGEQGRGFAVVADEVRKLAERTTGSTAEITAMIGAIQDETASFVKLLREVKPQVDRNAEVAHQATALLDRMNTDSIESLQQINSIAASMDELSEITKMIAGKIDSVMQMVDTSTASVAASHESSVRVDDLGSKMSQLVDRFRLARRD